jgi:hypothetical protein
MSPTTSTAMRFPTPPAAVPLSYRDRAVLRAVAAGRCTMAAGSLVVDGLCLSDQFVGSRLTKEGLIAAAAAGAARLTASGQALLETV